MTDDYADDSNIEHDDAEYIRILEQQLDTMGKQLAASEARVRELEEANKLMGADLVTRHDRICTLAEALRVATTELTRLRDCDWVISLPDRMDAVREIARNTLAKIDALMKGTE